MSGHLPATFHPAIPTGSWWPRKAVIKRAICRGTAVALVAAAAAVAGDDRAIARTRSLPVFAVPDSQFEPVAWADLPGWASDDHAATFTAFSASCRSILTRRRGAAEARPMALALREPCRDAGAVRAQQGAAVRNFFEQHFIALRLARLGDQAGFVTGYYEPILDGSRTQSEAFPVPVYRRPASLFVRGYRQSSAGLPNKGQVFRKIGRRKLVPFYDRAEIEDGALADRGLELCWLKNHTDLLFMQIQGSARIRLDDGTTLRLNYDSHNGHPYTPVGRVLIDRGIVPKEEMSMQRIRKWMDENPDGAKELRRHNRSYVFFRKVNLKDQDEPLGAQGIPLVAGRSIAVDKALHVYGTPFYIHGLLPLDGATSQVPFQRLMLAQDTGSAIIGPARADIYFGAGAEAGRIAGQLRHPAQFAVLVPKALDPAPAARRMPLPKARPSEKIAKLFPPTSNTTVDSKEPALSAATAKDATNMTVPLPLARPEKSKTESRPPLQKGEAR